MNHTRINRRSLSTINTTKRELYQLKLEYKNDHSKDELISAKISIRALTANGSEASSSSSSSSDGAELPQSIVRALHVDPPVELMFLGEDVDSVKHNSVEDRERGAAPLLLFGLHSSSRMWLIYLLVDENEMPSVVQVTEPFEDLLLAGNDGGTFIRRVRPAISGSVTIAPPGSMAMMLSNGVLALYHHRNRFKKITQHDCYDSMKGEIESDDDPLVDFCFAHSSSVGDGEYACGYIGELTVLLLRRSGDVYALSPVCFDGTFFHKTSVLDQIEYLEHCLSELKPPSMTSTSSRYRRNKVVTEEEARWRQIKTALLWINEVFGDLQEFSVVKMLYVSARIGMLSNKGASSCPLQVQGPLLYGRSEIDDGVSSPPASIIECMRGTATSQSLPTVFFAVGRYSGQVDICALSSGIEMRFALERGENIDNCTIGSGAVMQTICFDQRSDSDSYDGDDKGSILSLITDTRTPDLVHVANEQGVFSVMTGVIHGFERWVYSQATARPEFRPSAWSCMKVSRPTFVTGLNVISDSRCGHVLFCSLSSGALESINVTSLKYLSEATLVSKDREALNRGNHSVSTENETNIAKLSAFSTITAPMISEIFNSVASIGKLSGSSKMVRDAGAAEVALLISMKEKIDGARILLLALGQKTNEKKNELRKNLEGQQKQLEKIRRASNEIKTRLSEFDARKTALESNSKILASRCAAVLEASRDLAPSMSQAESDYFNQLKRWETQVSQWKESASDVISRSKNMQRSWSKDTETKVDLSEEEYENCRRLLIGMDSYLLNSKVTMEKLRRKVLLEADRAGVALAHDLEACP